MFEIIKDALYSDDIQSPEKYFPALSNEVFNLFEKRIGQIISLGRIDLNHRFVSLVNLNNYPYLRALVQPFIVEEDLIISFETLYQIGCLSIEKVSKFSAVDTSKLFSELNNSFEILSILIHAVEKLSLIEDATDLLEVRDIDGREYQINMGNKEYYRNMNIEFILLLEIFNYPFDIDKREIMLDLLFDFMSNHEIPSIESIGGWASFVEYNLTNFLNRSVNYYGLIDTDLLKSILILEEYIIKKLNLKSRNHRLNLRKVLRLQQRIRSGRIDDYLQKISSIEIIDPNERSFLDGEAEYLDYTLVEVIKLFGELDSLDYYVIDKRRHEREVLRTEVQNILDIFSELPSDELEKYTNMLLLSLKNLSVKNYPNNKVPFNKKYFALLNSTVERLEQDYPEIANTIKALYIVN